MFVNPIVYYRGTRPTEEYLQKLEKLLDMHFVDIRLKPINDRRFIYESPYSSHIICDGNPDLSHNDMLMYSDFSYCSIPVIGKWDVSLGRGFHSINCPKGEYQVVIYTPSTWINWVIKKVHDKWFAQT